METSGWIDSNDACGTHRVANSAGEPQSIAQRALTEKSTGQTYHS